MSNNNSQPPSAPYYAGMVPQGGSHHDTGSSLSMNNSTTTTATTGTTGTTIAPGGGPPPSTTTTSTTTVPTVDGLTLSPSKASAAAAAAATSTGKKKDGSTKAPKKPRKNASNTSVAVGGSTAAVGGMAMPGSKATGAIGGVTTSGSKKGSQAMGDPSKGPSGAGTKRKKPASSAKGMTATAATNATTTGFTGGGMAGTPLGTAMMGTMNAGSGVLNGPHSSSNPNATFANNSAMNDAVMDKARYAIHDLVQQRTEQENRRIDPLWYHQRSTDEVFNTVQHQQATTATATANFLLPEQYKIVEAALSHNGLSKQDVTPQAMLMLLEQARRYASELMEEALNYCFNSNTTPAVNDDIYGNHNNPENDTYDESDPSRTADYNDAINRITKEDLLLAVEMREDDYFYNRNAGTSSTISISNQLPKLNLVAQQINRIPLPPIPSHCYSGIVLPLDNDEFYSQGEYKDSVKPFTNHDDDPLVKYSHNKGMRSQLLTARTYDIVSAAHVAQRMILAQPAAGFPTSPRPPVTSMPPASQASHPPQPVSLAGANSTQRRNSKTGTSDPTTTKSVSKKDKSSSGYGANRGRQIPIKLKGKDTTTNVNESKNT